MSLADPQPCPLCTSRRTSGDSALQPSGGSLRVGDVAQHHRGPGSLVRRGLDQAASPLRFGRTSSAPPFPPPLLTLSPLRAVASPAYHQRVKRPIIIPPYNRLPGFRDSRPAATSPLPRIPQKAPGKVPPIPRNPAGPNSLRANVPKCPKVSQNVPPRPGSGPNRRHFDALLTYFGTRRAMNPCSNPSKTPQMSHKQEKPEKRTLRRRFQ